MSLSSSRSPGAMRATRELLESVFGKMVPEPTAPTLPGVAASPAERELIEQFIQAMNGTVTARQAFVEVAMTAKKRLETDEEIGLTMANYARRMGRPEIIEIKREGNRIVALMRNLESQLVSLLTLTLRVVEQDGKLIIDDFMAQGIG